MEKVKTLAELQADYEALGKEIAKRKATEEAERTAKLAAEKEARKNELERAMDKLRSLLDMWCEDYGPYKTHIPRGSRNYDWFMNF